MQTLQSMYVAQVATLVWVAQSGEPLGGRRNDVVVGIALKRKPGEGAEVEDAQKATFRGVMDMVNELLSPDSG